MFKGLSRVTYQVPNLEKAKHWYRMILNAEPVFTTSTVAVFVVGNSTLLLTSPVSPRTKGDDSVIACWSVDDVALAYDQLLQAGALPHSEVVTAFGTTRASVRDPFGNVIGIVNAAMNEGKGTVERRPSETAMNVTFSRALAALDEREEIRGPDYLAEVFLSDDRKSVFKDSSARAWLIKNPPGMYEYVIARTIFFDQIFDRALRDEFPQIIFLGAGYDSRPYRFAGLIRETRIFEVDAHPTQQRKKELLQNANIRVPDRLTFVPINFKTDALNDILSKAGYDKSKKTLFILEGVSFYLSHEELDNILNFVKSDSPKGSMLCFDYRLLLPEGSQAYGAKEFMKVMQTMFAGEPLKFGLRDDEYDAFLSKKGFALIEHLTPEDMERKYLTLRDGSSAGKVTALFGFIHASV